MTTLSANKYYERDEVFGKHSIPHDEGLIYRNH